MEPAHILSQFHEVTGFQQEVIDGRNIVLGAKLLLALNAVAFILSYVVTPILLAIHRRPEFCDANCETDGCGLMYLLVEVNGGTLRVVVDLLYLAIVIPVLIYCFLWRVTVKDAHVRRRVYMVTLLVIYVKLWLLYMYPIGVHCSSAERALKCGGIGRSFGLDLIPECQSFGFFVLNKDMGLVMLSPVVVPECGKMRIFLWSFTGLYYLVAMLAVHKLVKTPDQRYHAYFDVIIGLVFLFFVNEAARHRKYYMERADQVSFALAHRQREASQSMFRILGYMLPSFLVGRMLQSPDQTISEHVQRASILFIKIVDFEQMVKRLSPTDLLQKLNSIFSTLDFFCTNRNVTKIETVAEEYMCAVGIVPADKAFEAENCGAHSALLALVRVAGDALEFSKSTQGDHRVVFQMGIHTGPLIAGVVGRKLPRFRLFGDTVNTAARMMQKGLPNEVQFGEATKRELPEGVRCRLRGNVDMKGKGVMKTYLLARNMSSVARPSPFNAAFRGSPTGVPGRMSAMSGTLQLASAVMRSGHNHTSSTAEWNKQAHEGTGMFEDALVNAAHRNDESWTDWLDCKGRDESAERFREWYYQNHLFKKLVKRLDKQLIFVFVLTFIETMYLADTLGRSSENPAWHDAGVGKWGDSLCPYLVAFDIGRGATGGHIHHEEGIEDCKHRCLAYGPCTAIEYSSLDQQCVLRRCPDATPTPSVSTNTTSCFFWKNEEGALDSMDKIDALDLPVRKEKLSRFILSRSFCFAIILIWRAIVSCTDVVATKGRLLEWLSVLSCCLISCVLFLSYEMMPQRFVADERHQIDQVIPVDFPISGVSRNITRLIAFPVYMMTITAFPFRFFPCSVFLIGTTFIIVMESGTVVKEFYLLPTYGGLWYFACFNFLRQFYSFQEEKLFRAQHAAGLAVENVMQRVQTILDTMMPKQVVSEISLQADAPLPSHKYQAATIAQSDLVGFTEMSTRLEPVEVVQLVEEIFRIFDGLTDRYGVYKIETVGDAYIAGMADPPLTSRHSPVTVLRLALAMVAKAEAWSALRGEEVRLRIGIHSGECVGGVVGKDMQRYHLFGPLCSCLDIVEGTSEPGRVQISTACFKELQRELGLCWAERVMNIADCRILCRTEEHLTTSKGEIHRYSEVGGKTYFLVPMRRRHTE